MQRWFEDSGATIRNNPKFKEAFKHQGNVSIDELIFGLRNNKNAPKIYSFLDEHAATIMENDALAQALGFSGEEAVNALAEALLTADSPQKAMEVLREIMSEADFGVNLQTRRLNFLIPRRNFRSWYR